VRPTMAGRRRSDGRAGAGCLLFYMRPSKAVRAASLHRHVRGMGHGMAACVHGVRQRCRWAGGARSARPGQGAHGVWRKGSGERRRCSTRGPTARGPADQGRPRQACTAAGGAAFVAPAPRHRTRRRTLWHSRGKTFRTSPVPLRFSQDF
jgi:hypothetical protein